MLEMFFTKDSLVENVLCSVLSCSEACLFFSDDLCLRLQSVQPDFAWMADEADHLVVLTLLQIAFLGKCDD